MPSHTFLNLPDEKKKTLLDAALKEFGRMPLDKASINQIIKDANIPRGSFYMYFKNIDELYFYILETYRDGMLHIMLTSLEEHQGDLILSYQHAFSDMVKYCMVEEHKEYFKNVFLNMNFKVQSFLIPNRQEHCHKEIDELVKRIDQSKLQCQTQNDMFDMLGLVMMLTMNQLMKCFLTDKSIDEMNAIYQRKLEILKKGIYKREVE